MRAQKVLPKELLEAIQEYIQGETIYIPKRTTSYHKWGICSGSRQYLDERNRKMREEFLAGTSIEDLAEIHHLSIETIKKIVYRK